MRSFIAIAVLAGGGFAFAGPVQADDPHSVADSAEFAGHTDIDRDGIVVVEVPEGAIYVLPEDHEDIVNVLELQSGTQGDGRLDAAQVDRTPAGRPVDAPPGSMEAAQTGMQHDIGRGTVRNTISPEETHSPILQERRAEDPGIGDEAAPQAQEPLETK